MTNRDVAQKELKASGLVPAPSSGTLPVPGTFSLLYESRDGRLCLFEDKQGHIVAVRSDRLA